MGEQEMSRKLNIGFPTFSSTCLLNTLVEKYETVKGPYDILIY